MSAELLDGERVAGRIKMELADRVQRLYAPVEGPARDDSRGDEPSSVRYVEMRLAECVEVGIRSFDVHLPPAPRNTTLKRSSIALTPIPCAPRFCAMPLPSGVKRGAGAVRVQPDKDVTDCTRPNLGRLVMGAPGPLPCTPNGIVELLAAYHVPVEESTS